MATTKTKKPAGRATGAKATKSSAMGMNKKPAGRGGKTPTGRARGAGTGSGA